ncbi:MAG: endonuclease III [Anaerolineae bacterium]|nr:endonuclease III [Anaerolineae bacterium]
MTEKNNTQQFTLWDYTGNVQPAQIKVSILLYSEKIRNELGLHNLLGKDEFELIQNDSNAFLFGLISDQSVKAEIAWSLPFELRKRINHLDLERLSIMTIDELTEILKLKPALHRYPSQMAKYIVLASQRLKKQYQGKASKIWDAPANAAEIIHRLEEFSGIGHKKASLGVMLLVRDFGLIIPDTSSIDIAYDIHIRRIFLRSALANKDSAEEVLSAARSLHPDYPGLLTTPFWLIGRNWCHPTNPNCNECPINKGCAKKIELGKDINA